MQDSRCFHHVSSKILQSSNNLVHCANTIKRLKGAIDNRIAEETARAKASASPVRSASTARRSSAARNSSPSKRAKPRAPVEDDGARGPDPSEFEAAFIIDDESEAPTQVNSPALPPMDEKASEKSVAEKALEGNEAGEQNGSAEAPKPVEIPQEVRAKLRKLEKLEARYAGMVTFI
jgi:hypothetical protein